MSSYLPETSIVARDKQYALGALTSRGRGRGRGREGGFGAGWETQALRRRQWTQALERRQMRAREKGPQERHEKGMRGGL